MTWPTGLSTHSFIQTACPLTLLVSLAASMTSYSCFAAADRPPVQWVEIDPQRETLAQVRLLQPDWMWAAQLEGSKDTATQSAAVAGLAALRPTTHTVVSALQHCLQDDQVYPRLFFCPSKFCCTSDHVLFNLT